MVHREPRTIVRISIELGYGTATDTFSCPRAVKADVSDLISKLNLRWFDLEIDLWLRKTACKFAYSMLTRQMKILVWRTA